MDKVIALSKLTDFDIRLFKAGNHYRLYGKLGAHPMNHEGTEGTYFAVWAPNAKQVSVIGNFNLWNGQEHHLFPRWDESGIWEGFIPNLHKGDIYKFEIQSHNNNLVLEKGDPFALLWEVPPKTASVVWDLDYTWQDQHWMEHRKEVNRLDKPFSIYEVHLGSWKRKMDGTYHSYDYRDLAESLVAYVKEMGFTHVEFLPITEHPFFGSWGYQVTGYFAPTARYGTPQDFMYLVDQFHQNGIGVIVDWVPSHFPNDSHGLERFDGTHLYEHADPKQGYHPDWKSYIFNYGRNEVRAFLISNALFWLDKYHIDGLRVDAVASMLYLDYSRKEGEWIPNDMGGRENIKAISFLKEMNIAIYTSYPDVQTIAEESTAWTGVSHPTYTGGLGFGMKWMMGWMHDTLEYFSKNPIHRKYHQNEITFSLHYAFTENFLLPLSHDEVVHGKGSLISRMPGDEWQRFANLRLMYSYMYTHPGNKLLFMGGEIGQTSEWNHDGELNWDLLQYEPHRGIKTLLQNLNQLLKSEPALHEIPFKPQGFEWIDFHDAENSILAYIRKGKDESRNLIVVGNFTPIPREAYRIGVFPAKAFEVIFNSDDSKYWGSSYPVADQVEVENQNSHNREQSIVLSLPPLSIIILKPLF